MSLRKVLIEWIQWVDPHATETLDADDQRQLTADVYTVEPEFLTDAISDSLARHPLYAADILAAYRTNDFLQMGAVLDRMLRGYLIGSKWLESEMREVAEQESMYDGDQ
jgi:hypothetical protein